MQEAEATLLHNGQDCRIFLCLGRN